MCRHTRLRARRGCGWWWCPPAGAQPRRGQPAVWCCAGGATRCWPGCCSSRRRRWLLAQWTEQGVRVANTQPAARRPRLQAHPVTTQHHAGAFNNNWLSQNIRPSGQVDHAARLVGICVGNGSLHGAGQRTVVLEGCCTAATRMPSEGGPSRPRVRAGLLQAAVGQHKDVLA